MYVLLTHFKKMLVGQLKILYDLNLWYHSVRSLKKFIIPLLSNPFLCIQIQLQLTTIAKNKNVDIKFCEHDDNLVM